MNTLAVPKAQPRGLYLLFFVELWERFGFYCVISNLVLYLSKVLGFIDVDAYNLYSSYSALMYIFPVLGGLAADRILGFRRSILLGAVLYGTGYFLLASLRHEFFYVSLACLILGNGFFKSCVSSLVGTLYTENDPRRDSGFTIFYMGINIGSFLAPLISAYLAVNYGWRYGFGSALVGMVICFLECVIGFRRLGSHGEPPLSFMSLRPSRRLLIHGLLGLGIIGAVFGVKALLIHNELVADSLNSIAALIFLSLVVIAFRYDRVARNKLLALVILVVFSIAFWAFYTQIWSSFVLYSDRNVNRVVLGFTIPASMLLSVQAFFVIAFSPIFAWFWMRLGRFNPSTPMKFSLGIILLSFCFLSLVMGITTSLGTGETNVGWMVLAYALLAMGELSLSPVGLSMITQLAPAELTGMVMGIWFLALSTAFNLGGRLADLTSIPKTLTDPHLSALLYRHNFWLFGITSLMIGFILMGLTPLLNKLIDST